MFHKVHLYIDYEMEYHLWKYFPSVFSLCFNLRLSAGVIFPTSTLLEKLCWEIELVWLARDKYFPQRLKYVHVLAFSWIFSQLVLQVVVWNFVFAIL